MSYLQMYMKFEYLCLLRFRYEVEEIMEMSLFGV